MYNKTYTRCIKNAFRNFLEGLGCSMGHPGPFRIDFEQVNKVWQIVLVLGWGTTLGFLKTLIDFLF